MNRNSNECTVKRERMVGGNSYRKLMNSPWSYNHEKSNDCRYLALKDKEG